MPRVGTRIGAGLALCALALGLRLSIGVAPAHASGWSTCKYFSQLPDDCAGAEQRRFDNLRGYRYVEIDLFAKDALKKIPYVSVYDTIGQNGGDDSRDSAPRELLVRLDPKKIAKQYQALLVTISPSLTWTADWLADRVGAVRNFGGLDAAWMGNSQAPASKFSAKPAPSEAYRAMWAAKSSIEGFKKGSQVYLLDDPKGRTWVLLSYTDKYLPGMTIDKLDSLGDDLKLPPGWKFRTAKLSKELVLEPKGGSAGLIQDDKANLYGLTGAGQSNLTP
jgi:hypothetical protein